MFYFITDLWTEEETIWEGLGRISWNLAFKWRDGTGELLLLGYWSCKVTVLKINTIEEFWKYYPLSISIITISLMSHLKQELLGKKEKNFPGLGIWPSSKNPSEDDPGPDQSGFNQHLALVSDHSFLLCLWFKWLGPRLQMQETQVAFPAPSFRSFKHRSNLENETTDGRFVIAVFWSWSLSSHINNLKTHMSNDFKKEKATKEKSTTWWIYKWILQNKE